MTPTQFNIAKSSQYRDSPNLELDLDPEEWVTATALALDLP